MDPRTPSEVEATGTLPVAARVGARSPRGARRRVGRPDWVEEARAGLDRARQVPRLRGRRPAHRRRRLARVDADRPLAGRRRPLRRRDGLAPSCAGRQPGRRRTRARRPLAERRSTSTADRVEWSAADRRRRDRDRPPHHLLPRHRHRRLRRLGRRPPSPSRPYRRAVSCSALSWPRRSRSCRSRAGRARPRRCGRWPTCCGASGSTCSPSTSTRRATCRTTSTSRRTRRPTIADVLSGDAKAKAAVHDGIIPATPILAEVERSLSGKMGRELVLRKALKDAAQEHDVILIDCPPALGLLTDQRPRRRRLGADLLRGAVLRAPGRPGRARGDRAGEGVLQPRSRVARRA